MRRIAAVIAMLAVFSVPARSAEVRINGFGQVIAGQTLGDQQTRGTDYDDELSFAPESLFALQLTAPLSERIDAVAQLVGRGREDYEPEFAWAYLRYLAGKNWSVKAGRQRLPFYRYSEVIEVGAAYPYLRLPRPVYDAPFNNYDGISLYGSYALGGWEIQPQLLVGSFEGTLRMPPSEITTPLRLDEIWGGSVDLARGDWLTLRASYVPSTVSFSIDDPGYAGLLQALRATGNEEAADRIETDEEEGYYWSVGGELRHRGAFLGAEYKRYRVKDSLLGRAKGYYVSGGYSWRKWTPYLSWGRLRAGPGSEASSVTSIPALQAGVAALEAGFREDSDTLTAGLRYDLRPNVALKAEYARENRAGQDQGEVVAAGIVFTY